MGGGGWFGLERKGRGQERNPNWNEWATQNNGQRQTHTHTHTHYSVHDSVKYGSWPRNSSRTEAACLLIVSCTNSKWDACHSSAWIVFL